MGEIIQLLTRYYMQYLMRKNSEKAAHIWNGADTACKMWSTGGMNRGGNWILVEDPGHRKVCAMCKSKEERTTQKGDDHLELLRKVFLVAIEQLQSKSDTASWLPQTLAACDQMRANLEARQKAVLGLLQELEGHRASIVAGQDL